MIGRAAITSENVGKDSIRSKPSGVKKNDAFCFIICMKSGNTSISNASYSI